MNKSLLVAAALAMANSLPTVGGSSGYRREDLYKSSTRYRKNGNSPAQKLQERARQARIK